MVHLVVQHIVQQDTREVQVPLLVESLLLFRRMTTLHELSVGRDDLGSLLQVEPLLVNLEEVVRGQLVVDAFLLVLGEGLARGVGEDVLELWVRVLEVSNQRGLALN